MSRNDKSIRLLLSAIAVLLGANLLVQVGQTSGTRTAVAAGIPDSGAQMQAMVDQLVELNKRVDKLQGYIESGNMTVKVSDPKASK